MASPPPPIRGRFVGHHGLGWAPNEPTPATIAVAPPPTNIPAPTAYEELRQELATAIAAKIQALKLERNSASNKSAQADINAEIKVLSAARAVAHDPSSRPAGLQLVGTIAATSVSGYIQLVKTELTSNAESCTDIWTNKKQLNKSAPRSSANTKAQKEVPDWYDGRCPLTGVEVVDAAHIIDVQATKAMTRPVNFWEMLRRMWPLEEIQQLGIAGQENRNILPLQPTAHRLWDRNSLGLRPIPHETDPQSKMYLQVVWFNDWNAEIGLGEKRTRETQADLSDGRRVVEKVDGRIGNEFLCHGDVYELSTSDYEKRPLPEIRFLEIRYAVQKLFAGQQAAGALRDIFDGQPPDDDTTTPIPDGDAFMPADWDNMIDDAGRLGILDFEGREAWKKHTLQIAYEQHQRQIELARSESEGEEDD
ncbi:hypothetical protein B0J18DRAFT_58720 [Chaetomium sp. MPI-SDFR-AT-0129]|nr:hypothetical protein B0J18DRAFT_58720 [Chaetomium sp. MPI-SDFR-AT-0129]